MPIDYSDIIGSDSEGESGSLLGTDSPKFNRECFLEITLTHPHTQGWLKKTTTEQKKWFSVVWNKIKNSLGIPKDSKFVFEYHKNGQVHLHGVLLYDIKDKFYINGMVLDYVRSYIKYLPAKYNKLYDKLLNQDKHYYQSAPVKVSYRVDNPERYEEWIAYLLKEQTQ